MTFSQTQVPAVGEKIRMLEGQLRVPAVPVIPFIEGDGIGPDVWHATRRVMDAAVKKSLWEPAPPGLDGSAGRAKGI